MNEDEVLNQEEMGGEEQYAPETETEEQSDEGTPESEVEESTEDTESPEFSLDEDGNLNWNQGEDESEDSKEQPEEEGDSEKEESEEPTYKVKVDGKEVDVTQEELLRSYMRQADYTRKTQQLASERRALEQERAAMQAREQSKPQPERATPPPDLTSMAKDIAARNLGLESADDLSELDFNHITAVVEAKNALTYQQALMNQRVANIANLEAELQASDPKYQDILGEAKSLLEKLPHSEYEALRKAYENGDAVPLRKFFKTASNSYYKKAVNSSKKRVAPPKVVSSGNTRAGTTSKKVNMDLNSFGGLSADAKAQKLIEWGIV